MYRKKMKKFIINWGLFLTVPLLFVFANTKSKDHAYTKSETIKTIEKKMDVQQKAWNNANLEGFMKPYWKSDSLMFIGKNGIKLGWQTTLSNYKKSYANKNEMGQLKFENNDYKTINSESILVTGKWLLNRNEDLGDLSGYYTLLWKKINNGWVIVYDHSS